MRDRNKIRVEYQTILTQYTVIKYIRIKYIEHELLLLKIVFYEGIIFVYGKHVTTCLTSVFILLGFGDIV